MRYRGVQDLSDMLICFNQVSRAQTSNILYYEVLDIPLPELQSLITLKVAFRHSTKDEVVSHSIRLSKNSTVGNAMNYLKSKVELSRSDAELRLIEIFPSHEKIENINETKWNLRAEEIPAEEANLGPQDRLIHVCHFMKDTILNKRQVRNFRVPFLFVIHECETLAEVKTRIQKELRVPDEEFAEWKFAFISMGRTEYLKDTDIIFSRFQRRYAYGWEQYLGLEHTNTS
ncbi:hypothetical protein LUZ63_005596 [Rhynchospora breviuscula]|uniref:ubiquitinyl hydrolase 1 n=1 Tax=Rhynchospora breviuscula TaxID=2022672 RepID=A0A9Q0CPB6_9POAL|nr:hypothetical protein LUZ63_005596 [Rhynchospora breviuscula]